MMTIENIVGDIVLLVFDNHEPLAELGITKKTLYAKIKGYDEYGLWIDHPKFKILKGKPKSSAGKKKPALQTVTASLLIPWSFLVSIVHFPGLEGFDYPSPFETHIGFEINEE
ncbi:MAG: hypothetical protein GXO92_09020 [FCB group bacterium]|nr:hypothetical protein [FCB group bacterium]